MITKNATPLKRKTNARMREHLWNVFSVYTSKNISSNSKAVQRNDKGYDNIMVKTLNKYYNFCIIDLRMDVQFLEGFRRQNIVKWSEKVYVYIKHGD